MYVIVRLMITSRDKLQAKGLNLDGSLNDCSDSNVPASSRIAISRKLASRRSDEGRTIEGEREENSDSPIDDLSFRNAGFRRALYRHSTGPQSLYHSNLALLYSPGRVDRR